MNINTFTNGILKIIGLLLENILRIFGLIFIIDELLSFGISDRKGILKDVFSGVYLGSIKEFFWGLLIVVLFIIISIWVFQPLISFSIKKIFKVKDIKELKKTNILIQSIRIIAIILCITCGIIFIDGFYKTIKKECGFSNIFEVVKEIQSPTYKTQDKNIITKTKYYDGKTMYIIKIKKSYIQKYSSSLKITILFRDSDGFLVHRENILTPIKNYNLFDGYYEYVGAFTSTKKDFKKIHQVSWEWKN